MFVHAGENPLTTFKVPEAFGPSAVPDDCFSGQIALVNDLPDLCIDDIMAALKLSKGLGLALSTVYCLENAQNLC